MHGVRHAGVICTLATRSDCRLLTPKLTSASRQIRLYPAWYREQILISTLPSKDSAIRTPKRSFF